MLIKYIDRLLEFQWGHWQREGGAVVAGYPKMDVSQMINNGGRGTGLNIDRNEEAEYINKLILQLNKHQIRALKRRYIWMIPDYLAAKDLHTNVKTYRSRIYRAHDRLNGLVQENNQFNWR